MSRRYVTLHDHDVDNIGDSLRRCLATHRGAERGERTSHMASAVPREEGAHDTAAAEGGAASSFYVGLVNARYDGAVRRQSYSSVHLRRQGARGW